MCYGHNRDGKRDRPIIVYGVLTATEGRPLSVDVYLGNTGDATTVPGPVKNYATILVFPWRAGGHPAASGRRKKKILRKEEIPLKVGRVVNLFKMAKHFAFTIEDGRFRAQRREEQIREEGLLDGMYVIRTSETKGNLSSPDVVRHYKNLTNVERAFRCWKGMDIRVWPIYLRAEEHVRVHTFLCLLAYYVEWHMREALAPLLFAEEDLAQYRQQRDPCIPNSLAVLWACATYPLHLSLTTDQRLCVH